MMVEVKEMSDEELNIAIAVEVMGWKEGRDPESGSTNGRYILRTFKGVTLIYANPVNRQYQPSTDIATAWQVMEHLRTQGWTYEIGGEVDENFRVELWRWNKTKGDVWGYLNPMAVWNRVLTRCICECALLAIRTESPNA